MQDDSKSETSPNGYKPREWRGVQTTDDPEHLVWTEGEFIEKSAYDTLKAELAATEHARNEAFLAYEKLKAQAEYASPPNENNASGECIKPREVPEIHGDMYIDNISFKSRDGETIQIVNLGERLYRQAAYEALKASLAAVNVSLSAATTDRWQLEAELEKLKAERDELKGVLSLNEDEYVRQVGTWKIIQRLEEERDQLRTENECYKTECERLDNFARQLDVERSNLRAESHMKGESLDTMKVAFENLKANMHSWEVAKEIETYAVILVIIFFACAF